jgi:uncharacterized protein YggL (DUF469 family)
MWSFNLDNQVQEENQEESKDVFLDNLKATLQSETIVSLYITESGEFVMLTNGEMNEVQKNIATKMLTAADPSASFVLKSFIYIEILFNRLEDKIASFFKAP